MPKLKEFENLNIKDALGKLAGNLSWLFFIIFIVLLILEAFTVKHSVDLILSSNVTPASVPQEHGTSIDFSSYNAIVSRIEQASAFTPNIGTTTNPFGSSQ